MTSPCLSRLASLPLGSVALMLGLVACGSGSVGGDTGMESGPGAELRVAPDLLDLGKVRVGDTVTGDLSIGNLGLEAATVTFSLEVSHPETWSFSPSTMTVQANRHDYLTVSLSPTGWGDHSGIIVISDTDGTRLFEVPVNSDVDDAD